MLFLNDLIPNLYRSNRIFIELEIDSQFTKNLINIVL